MITVEQLREYGSTFLAENFGLRLYIPVGIGQISEHSDACYIVTQDSMRPVEILVAPSVIEYGTDAVVYAIFRHELIHHALHMIGVNFLDGAPAFEKTLEFFGATATETVRVGPYFEYECQECGDIFYHYDSVHQNSGLTTECCEASFERRGWVNFNGEGEIV